MPTILITGAGRGLGAELVRQFVEDDWDVIATTRGNGDLDNSGKFRCERLDVSDRNSINELSLLLKETPIDVLLNNAGVNRSSGVNFGSNNFEDWIDEYRINTLGPLMVAEAFVEHVARSTRKQMVFISSRTGSNTLNTTSGSPGYRASKAALNSAIRSTAVDLLSRGITCVLMHPGWVQTDMGGSNADLDVKTSIRGVCKVIKNLKNSDNGCFLNYDGSAIPW